MMKKAIIAGATGLIGGELLKLLLENNDYQEVISISRRDLNVQHHKLVQLIINFDHLDQHINTLKADVIFCCLGTTRKKTPDLTLYHKIDYGYPVQLGQIAKLNKINQYHFVSSIGADSQRSNFYLKTKGEAESALAHLNLNCLHIYQPSALTGKRTEQRPLERFLGQLMPIVNPLLIGKFKKYRSIPGLTVAKAMYNLSLNNEPGIFIHPSDHIKQLA